MVDLTAIAAVTSSLKAAGDITKAAIGLRDAQALQSKVIELNDLILDAQRGAFSVHSDQFALIERVRDLERQIASLEAWEAKKERYELNERVPGVFAYKLKEGVQPSEPPHYICQTCYEQGAASILQKKMSGSFKLQLCPRCKTEIRIAVMKINYSVPMSGRRYDGW